MKKETVFAVVLGIGLGVIVAIFLVVKSRQAQIQNSKPITASLSITPTPLAKNINADILDISQPETGTIVNANSVIIKGKVAKESLVIIQSPIKTQVIKNSPEDLNVNFPLAFGENVIHMTVYPKDTQMSVKEKDLQIYYFDEQ